MAQFPNSTGPNSGVWTLEDVYNARIGGNWPATLAGDRGVYAGGNNPSLHDTIDIITVSTTGNATDFGNLTSSRSSLQGVGSKTRAVFSHLNNKFSLPHAHFLPLPRHAPLALMANALRTLNFCGGVPTIISP